MTCPREQETLEARRSGQWSEELRAHFAACESCADALLVAGFMEEATATDVAVPPVGLVWWKAQLRARREAAENATRPIWVAERTAAVAAALGAVVVAAWLSSESSLLAALSVGGLVLLAASAACALWLASSRE